MGTGRLHEDARQATNQKAAVMAHVPDLTSRSRRLELHRCSFRSTNWPFGVGLKYFSLIFLNLRWFGQFSFHTQQTKKKVDPQLR
jgi:hypothetical protein